MKECLGADKETHGRDHYRPKLGKPANHARPESALRPCNIERTALVDGRSIRVRRRKYHANVFVLEACPIQGGDHFGQSDIASVHSISGWSIGIHGRRLRVDFAEKAKPLPTRRLERLTYVRVFSNEAH